MTYGTLCTLIISVSRYIWLLQVLNKQNINPDISKHKAYVHICMAYVYDQTYINQPNIPLPSPLFSTKTIRICMNTGGCFITYSNTHFDIWICHETLSPACVLFLPKLQYYYTLTGQTTWYITVFPSFIFITCKTPWSLTWVTWISAVIRGILQFRICWYHCVAVRTLRCPWLT